VSLGIVILAADQSMRMRPDLTQVLHPIAGRPLVLYSVETARALGDLSPVLVAGHGAEDVRQVVGERATCVEQAEQLGTAHAVLQARPALERRATRLLVIHADMPLLREETLRRLVRRQEDNPGPVTMLTVVGGDPRGFGRVIRDGAGAVVETAAETAATPGQPAIREYDTGIYCFDAEWLWDYIDGIPPSQPGREAHLTDLVSAAVVEGREVAAIQVEDAAEVVVIYTRVHLAQAERNMRQRINRRWMEAGVTMLDPDATYIEAEVTIGRDTEILPNTFLRGQTTVGARCHIGPGSVIEDSTIGDECRVVASIIEEAVMERGSDVGPFSHLRPGARVEAGAHVGNFGEIKNATLGAGAHMGHFSYLGDAEVGAGANIGAGTITCNFDGERKHHTVIGERAFIGSDTMLVAPVRVGRDARTGAGSVVTRDVPDGAVAYGVPARVRREKQE
jgi:bifunctional UDP-N-acetylglucosamine pyrophosphorylase/glucosamine-1-phosphate N-acetyltransferase